MTPAFSAALTYVEQTAAQLRYRLLDGTLPRDTWPILAERRLEAAWATITLRIVGASHTCELRGDGWALTEALVGGAWPAVGSVPCLELAPACTRAGATARAVPARLPDQPGTRPTTGNTALTVAVDLVRNELAPEAVAGYEARLLRRSGQVLAARYPAGGEIPAVAGAGVPRAGPTIGGVAAGAGAGGPTGVTRLRWRLGRRGFDLLTYHTYPEERILIRSLTRYRLVGGVGEPTPDQAGRNGPGGA